MQKTKKFAMMVILSALVLFLIVPNTAFADPEMVLRFAGQVPIEHTATKLMQQVADEVKEKTDGRIVIEVYPANQLGDYTVVQEKIGIGSVEMGIMSAATNVDKKLLAYTLQYVVPNYELAKKNYASGTPFADYVAKLYEKQNIKVLAYWPVYFGGIGLLKEPAEPLNPTSPKNLKVRVPTMKTWEALADAFGYMATPLPFAEFFTAAQTGIVDGIFGGGAENYYVSFQDLMKCYIAANTHFECWPFTINLELYESLSEADRKLLDEKARELEERRWVKAVTDQDHYVDLMEQAGTVVYRPTDEQLKEFARIGREVSWGEFKKVVGDKVYDEIVSTFVLE